MNATATMTTAQLQAEFLAAAEQHRAATAHYAAQQGKAATDPTFDDDACCAMVAAEVRLIEVGLAINPAVPCGIGTGGKIYVIDRPMTDEMVDDDPIYTLSVVDADTIVSIDGRRRPLL